jgi:hypothetical protein
MHSTAWLIQILKELETLDAAIAPGGLYAADRGMVFSKVLFSALKSEGYRIGFSKGGEYANFVRKSGEEAGCVRLETISKIKVRQFGAEHMLDRHVHHDARWEEKKMERLLSKLWSESTRETTSLVLLLGFDSPRQALGAELRRLEGATAWERHGVSLHSRIWSDPHNRGFFTCACLWAKNEAANHSPQPTTELAPGRG